MRIKKFTGYLLKNVWSPTFAIVVLSSSVVPALLYFFFWIASGKPPHNQGSFSGTELFYSSYMLILGICNFKSGLFTALGNGISRKTYLVSSSAAAAIISFAVAIFCTFMWLIYSNTIYVDNFYSLFELLYNKKSMFIKCFYTPLFNFLLMISSYMLGFCISAIAYRTSRAMRILIITLSSLTAFIILPILEVNAKDSIYMRFFNFIGKVYGIGDDYGTGEVGRSNYIRTMVMLTLSSMLLYALSWILIRTASVSRSRGE